MFTVKCKRSSGHIWNPEHQRAAPRRKLLHNYAAWWHDHKWHSWIQIMGSLDYKYLDARAKVAQSDNETVKSIGKPPQKTREK